MPHLLISESRTPTTNWTTSEYIYAWVEVGKFDNGFCYGFMKNQEGIQLNLGDS